MDWLQIVSTLATAIIPAIISYLIARNQCKNDLKRAAQESKTEIERLMKQHEIDIEALREKHRMEMETQKQNYEYTLLIMQKEYELKIAEQKEEKSSNIVHDAAAGIIKSFMSDPTATRKNLQGLVDLRDSLKDLRERL